MQMDPDFREFVESFNDHEVRYLVVGGYALAAHGLPRATGDLDAWVWVDDDNAERILAALAAFGFGGLGLEASDFDHPDSVVQLGYPPYRIDILTSIDGVDFEDAWERRLSIKPLGVREGTRSTKGAAARKGPVQAGATTLIPSVAAASAKRTS